MIIKRLRITKRRKWLWWIDHKGIHIRRPKPVKLS